MIRYRKARAHIGSNNPEQLKRWAKEFPGCNWGIEIDRSCITVVDLARGARSPADYGFRPVLVTATIGGTHQFYQNTDRDPIAGEPEIMTAKVGPASADGDADAAWFWLNIDQTLHVRRARSNEQNIEEGITVTIVRTVGPGIRTREFWMVPEDLVGYVLKYGERCLVDDGSGIVMPGSNVDGELLEWPKDGCA
jgi:hypothetical protein